MGGGEKEKEKRYQGDKAGIHVLKRLIRKIPLKNHMYLNISVHVMYTVMYIIQQKVTKISFKYSPTQYQR